MSARIIAVAIEKGGIGKTTTVVNLATLFAKSRKKVLVIDCDPQANASLTFLQKDKQALAASGLFDLVRSYGLPGVDASAFVHATNVNGVDIIPSNLHTKQLSELLRLHADTYGMASYKFVAACIEPIVKQYDIVLLDTPPSQDDLAVSALYACHDVIIPLLADKYSKEGLLNTLTLISELERKESISINILGVLFVKAERTVMQDIYREQIATSDFGRLLFKTEIRKGQAVNESIEYGAAVVETAPRSNPASDYKAFYKELCKRMGAN